MTTTATTGLFVAVVGPSGVGKDSLLNFAREQLADDPRFTFVRRIVTRSADAGLEDHDTVTHEAFEDVVQAKGYALHWDAHELRYGLPGDIHEDLNDGRVVIANISRKSIDDARARFPACRILSITAPRDVLAKRLLARGRETAADVEVRLSRNLVPVTGSDVTEIANAGTLADAGNHLVQTLRDFAHNGMMATKTS